MKKILHVAETIKGGVATVIRTISASPDDHDSNYELVYLVPLDQKKELHGIDERQIRTFERSGRDVRSLLRFAWQLTRVMLKEKPDVVHLHSTFSGVIGRVVCVLLRPWRKPKIVYCPHAFSFLMESSPTKQKLYAWIERVLQRVTDVIICVSRYEMDRAARFGIQRKRMKLIYNGIHQRDEVPKAKGPEPIHLLFVGRLDYQKGFDVLLKAFAKVQRSDLKLTVVGSAVNEDTVECPEMDAVEYLPWVTPAEVHALYQQADALIVPSRWEGFAMVPLEGMAMGLPVIASNCTSLPELVTHEVSGYVFPTGDHQALADVLARIQKPRLLDLGSEGRNIVRERFSAARMIRQTYDVYCAPTY
ncbi:glycosyltransferase [Pseudomonas koreensis]|uniref:glycosyltransferase n=1 Tax=Pseudomonas koreensis TaxID=198620 RepID=UPI0009F582CC|nr:glycosyltransferase [Pseudomonas koreensis]KAB0511095.1 glycosyltransferase family 4 protein [Pseudomonas koreensis]MCM8743134.1 glycosyltransferase [Pseudomonas koreensis]NNA64145.1 glycosyltransferase family 4 protein [Pseudomonas koreensis]GGK44737.1 glycosyl transferase [Pseudomonas koreensis]